MRTKDLASLLRLLQLSGQSGMLLLRPPEEIDNEAWIAQCQLDDGIVTMCRVIAKSDGQVAMSNETALQWLMRLGTLQWWLDEKQTSQESSVPQQTAQSEKPTLQPLEQSPLAPATWTPVSPEKDASRQERKPAHLTASQLIPVRTLRKWQVTESDNATREQRQVWLLIDGQRSVEEMSQLLNKPLLAILKLLVDLKSNGFIQ